MLKCNNNEIRAQSRRSGARIEDFLGSVQYCAQHSSDGMAIVRYNVVYRQQNVMIDAIS